jgi:hypothetical protein
MEIIILIEVSQFRKRNVTYFFSYVEDRYEYKHYHIYIYAEQLSNTGTA